LFDYSRRQCGGLSLPLFNVPLQKRNRFVQPDDFAGHSLQFGFKSGDCHFVIYVRQLSDSCLTRVNPNDFRPVVVLLRFQLAEL
jgi:hypothetical protein